MERKPNNRKKQEMVVKLVILTMYTKHPVLQIC